MLFVLLFVLFIVFVLFVCLFVCLFVGLFVRLFVVKTFYVLTLVKAKGTDVCCTFFFISVVLVEQTYFNLTLFSGILNS